MEDEGGGEGDGFVGGAYPAEAEFGEGERVPEVRGEEIVRDGARGDFEDVEFREATKGVVERDVAGLVVESVNVEANEVVRGAKEDTREVLDLVALHERERGEPLKAGDEGRDGGVGDGTLRLSSVIETFSSHSFSSHSSSSSSSSSSSDARIRVEGRDEVEGVEGGVVREVPVVRKAPRGVRDGVLQGQTRHRRQEPGKIPSGRGR